MTLAVLLLAYYREKPPRHRLGRKPGYVASASATMGILLYVVFALTHRALTPPVGITGANYLSLVLVAFPAYGGMAVAGAWVALALGRRWRPEASSIDRLGRFLGAFWILLIVVDWGLHLARW